MNEQLTEPLLQCRQLTMGYGALAVARDVSLSIGSGEVVALLGPNGAGKTTTLLTLAGELAPISGEVLWKGTVTTAPMHARCRNGLGYITEEKSVIMNLTARENLRLADVTFDKAMTIFPELDRFIERRAGLLSGGEQQMLSLARALGREPEVLLADELSLGLAPMIVDRLLAAVRAAADQRGVGVLLVEQHVRKALTIADRVYVMERGKIAWNGTAQEARGNLEEIEAAYSLG